MDWILQSGSIRIHIFKKKKKKKKRKYRVKLDYRDKKEKN